MSHVTRDDVANVISRMDPTHEECLLMLGILLERIPEEVARAAELTYKRRER
jgi:hypothetical protein